MANAAAIVEGFTLMEGELKRDKTEPRPSTDVQKVARWVLLTPDLPDELFLRMCVTATNTLTFFPTVAELRQAGGLSVASKAEMAWQHLREQMGRLGTYATLFLSDLQNDAAALWVVSKMGWEQLCTTEGKDRDFKRTEFLKLYAAACEQGAVRTEPIAGQCERLNLANGQPIDTLAARGRSRTAVPPELVGQFGESLPLRQLAELPEGLKVLDRKALPMRRSGAEIPAATVDQAITAVTQARTMPSAPGP